MSKSYNSYKELLQDRELIARELLDVVGSGEWQNDTIFLYEDIEEFAEYELTDGWYSELDITRDWKGAPSLINYIDLKELGEDLSNNWDTGIYFKTSSGVVLQTGYGW